jgi:hypothetical protein
MCRQAGSKRFFLKKEAKTFIHWLRALPGEREAKRIEVFWFFFSKKNRFPCLPRQRGEGPPGMATFLTLAAMFGPIALAIVWPPSARRAMTDA